MGLINASRPFGKRRFWLTLGGVVLLGVLGYLTFIRWDKYWREHKGLSLLDRGDFAPAAQELSGASARYKSDKRLAFLAAVAFRRADDADGFESHLRRAERLGLPDSDVRLQRLLHRTQNGLGDDATEAALNDICLQGADDFTAEQIYEARAKGHLSLYQLSAAAATLNFWIEWKPKAATPRLLRAEIAEQSLDTAAAEAQYQAVLDADPDNVEALIRMSRSLISRHKQDEALALLRRCETLRPDDPRVIIGIAEIEYARGEDADKVEQTLQKALNYELDDVMRSRVWRVLADVYLDRKEFQRVIDLLEDAAERKDMDTPCYQALIRALFALGQRERAEHFSKIQQDQLRLLTEARATDREIRGNPNDPEPRFRRGQISLDAGREKDAMTWWYTALLVDPLHQKSHEALAKLYIAKGDMVKATQHQTGATQSVQRTFERAWQAYTHEDLAFVRSAIKDIARYQDFQPHAELLTVALEIHEKQKALDPGRIKKLEALVDYPSLQKYSLVVLGSALFQLQQFGAAERALLEALRLDPRSIQAHRWLVAMYKDIRALDLMYVHCQEWASLDPLDYRPHRLIGLESKSRAGFGEAITAYKDTLERNPPDQTRREVQVELAECHFESAQFQEAVKILEPAESTPARDILLARCYWELQRGQDSKKLVDNALQSDPKHRFGNLLRADIAIQEGELDVAVKHLEKVIEAFPLDHSGWFKLSQVYAQLKDDKKARECNLKAGQLRNAEARYYDTMEKAFHLPDDIEIRQQLVALARQIGRPDLAEEWERATQLLKTRIVPMAPAQPPDRKEAATGNEIPLLEPASGKAQPQTPAQP